MIVVERAGDLTSRVGQALGTSGWHTVTQDEVDHFAEATGNRAPIHTDPAFARSTPYGGTIAYGIQILAMAAMLLDELWELRVVGGVDSGYDRVRHLAPVPVGSRVRLTATVAEAEEVPGGVRVGLDCTFELEGSPRPACVARMRYVYFF